jgi:ferric-dicitrate binding protein FerR (iron transport regulator)
VVKLYNRRFVQVAAALIIIVFAAYLLYTPSHTPVLQQLATAKGQRLQKRLPDGTVVWLAPGSLLQYPAKFTSAQREVTLNGEAFFEVAHDTLHPFIVHAGDMHTRVLGTSFTIQAYDDQPAVAVTLVTGKVNVSGNGQQLQLVPSQRAILDKTTHQLKKEDAPDATLMLARRDGILHYKGTALQTVIRDLQLQYNVNITLPAAIQSCTYYGQLNTRNALAQVLQQIALTYDARLQQTNNQWEIVNGTCNN